MTISTFFFPAKTLGHFFQKIYIYISYIWPFLFYHQLAKSSTKRKNILVWRRNQLLPQPCPTLVFITNNLFWVHLLMLCFPKCSPALFFFFLCEKFPKNSINENISVKNSFFNFFKFRKKKKKNFSCHTSTQIFQLSIVLPDTPTGFIHPLACHPLLGPPVGRSGFLPCCMFIWTFFLKKPSVPFP